MELNVFDITKDAVPVQLKHPVTQELLFDGDPKDNKKCCVLLYGKDSAAFKERQRMLSDKALESTLKNRGRPKLSAAELEEDNIITLVACIAGFTNMEVDGKPMGSTAAEVRSVLERFPWIAEQADENITDRSNFIKSSAKR